MLQMSMFTTVETSRTTDEKSIRNEKPLPRSSNSPGKVKAGQETPINKDVSASTHQKFDLQQKETRDPSDSLFPEETLPVVKQADHKEKNLETQPVKTGPAEFEIQHSGDITTLRFQNDASALRPVLAPLLAYHSYNNDGRWVSWVGANSLDKSLLLQYGVNLSSLRMLVNEEDHAALLRIALAALSNGNSHLVVLLAESIEESFYDELAAAAEEGNASLIVLLPAC